MFKPADLFDLSQTTHAALFDGCEYAWDGLRKLKEYLKGNLRPALHNKCEGTAWIGERVFVGEGTVVEDGAMIKGPAIIAENETSTLIGSNFRARLDSLGYIVIEFAKGGR